MPDGDLLLVGRVARAHGNRGRVIVNLETDFPEDRFRVGQVLLVTAGGETVPRAILEVRFQQGRPILALEGVATMDAAEALAGAELKVPEREVEPLPEGTFYRHHLVGCRVEDRAGTVIGEVRAVEGSLEMSRLVIEGPRGEVLIPLAAEICVAIDLPRHRIVVDPPEGLIALNSPARG